MYYCLSLEIKSIHKKYKTALQLYKFHADFVDIYILDFLQMVAAFET